MKRRRTIVPMEDQTKPVLTHERLRQILDYNQETGELIWLVRTAQRIKIGDVAGSLNGNGRRQIKIGGRFYLQSRVIWFWMTGEWPPQQVDHRDTDCINQRWTNLRLATHSQNIANQHVRKNNLSGFKGVSRATKSSWRANIRRNGRNVYLGTFATPEAANAAYFAAALEVHGEFARSE